MITGYRLNMHKKFLSVRNGVRDARTASGPLKLLIKKLNKENAPPDGWARPGSPKCKPASSRFRMVLTNKRKYMRRLSSSQAFKLDRSGELG